MKLVFFAVLLSTLILNLTFQKKIADWIDPDRNAIVLDDSGEVRTSFLVADQPRLPDGVRLDIPQMATLENGNKGPYGDIRDLMAGLEGKIDVLFVGDSTISWGFDYHQFEVNSGLVARSLSFGLNPPDEVLAQAVAGIAHCLMSKNGVVILSFSDAVLGRERAARKQDKAVRRAAKLGNDPAKVAEFWRVDEAKLRTSKTQSTRNVLLDREIYNQHVFDKVVDSVATVSPFWSAKISLCDFVFSKPKTEDAIDESNPEEMRFLRWDPSFRIPIGESFNTWKNAPVSLIDAGLPAKIKRRRIRRMNLSHWSQDKIGVPVCTVFPITMEDETHRYSEWLNSGSSTGLLVYPNILRSVGIEQDLDLQRNHHLGNQSGLIMAAALGRYFKRFEVLEAIAGGKQPDDGTLYIRQ